MRGVQRTAGIGLAIAAIALVGASLVGAQARATRASWPKIADPPFAPSATAIPFASLGYREMAADLLWLRLVGYAGSDDDLADGNVALLRSIIAADPYFRPAYESGAERIPIADHGVDEAALRAAADILEEGSRRFPTAYRYPFNAGQIYALDLVSLPGIDEATRRAYGEKAVQLLERAVRLPGAPSTAGSLAANMLTKLGRAQQAEANLRALILTIDDDGRRQRLIKKLAEMRSENVESLRETLLAERQVFTTTWRRTRPSLPPGMFVLLGAAPSARIDLPALALDRDLLGLPDELLREPLPELADDVGEVVGPPAPR
jgi:tetratricopeptide (TPR) repeat protein